MHDDHAREVEDYTTAFLWMAGLILFMALFTIWAVFGYLIALMASGVTHQFINHWPSRAARR